MAGKQAFANYWSKRRAAEFAEYSTRVGGHHLTQHEIVPMETMVPGGRNGQDFRWSVIIPVKSDRVLPMRNENHIVLCRARSQLGG